MPESRVREVTDAFAIDGKQLEARLDVVPPWRKQRGEKAEQRLQGVHGWSLYTTDLLQNVTSGYNVQLLSAKAKVAKGLCLHTCVCEHYVNHVKRIVLVCTHTSIQIQSLGCAIYLAYIVLSEVEGHVRYCIMIGT